MAVSPALSSLSFEMKIIGAKNMDTKSTGHLFVRCYLSAGNNTRVRLNSKEISVKSNLIWNESFSLECHGDENSINQIMQESIVFELRWRKTDSVLGRIGGSQLLGRAEVPWKTVFQTPEKEFEKWVVMIPKSHQRVRPDVKPPAVQIAMSVHVPMEAKIVRQRREKLMKNDKCGCMDGGCCCIDYDIYTTGAALDAF